ncbi:hypothetical protein XENORESO_013002 [Xenotaenia resolanae]|uniref:Uncharacterized protein n=1 Tax=Xenotaenia resolanae TaxID=208358 RepID=A0ABV0W4R8_9TELE
MSQCGPALSVRQMASHLNVEYFFVYSCKKSPNRHPSTTILNSWYEMWWYCVLQCAHIHTQICRSVGNIGLSTMPMATTCVRRNMESNPQASKCKTIALDTES